MTAPWPALEREVRTVGSASLWFLGRVAGPRQEGAVSHAGADAVYVAVDGICLGILGARAVQVPCGVRTSLTRLPEVAVGAPAVVHDGSIVVPHLAVAVTDLVDTTVPVLSQEATSRSSATLADHVGSRLDHLYPHMAAPSLDDLRAADPAAAGRLLGLGPGLTPLGDDVLCGWLATAVAAGHPGLAPMKTAVALLATERTTTLSATLLACAARGEGVPQLHHLLSALARGDATVGRRVDALLEVGDSSGAGLVLGTLLALESAAGAGP